MVCRLLTLFTYLFTPALTLFTHALYIGKLMMLPSDLVLIEDPGFKTYVDIYAKDQKKFFSDFSSAFQRLEGKYSI